MDKNALIQYCDMKEEIKDLRRRITETEKQIFRIAEEGTVKDTVSGGMGGIQHFVVEGMPVPELSRKRLLLNKRKSMLIKKENELLAGIILNDEIIYLLKFSKASDNIYTLYNETNEPICDVKYDFEKQNIVIISNYGNDAIPPTTQVGTVLFVI